MYNMMELDEGPYGTATMTIGSYNGTDPVVTINVQESNS